jgi:DNA-binding CsgD family transcriptional regulator
VKKPSGIKTPPPSTRPPAEPAAQPSLERIVASAPALIFVLSLEGRCLYASRRGSLGSSVEEVGRLIEQIMPAEQAAAVRALMTRVAAADAPRTIKVAGTDAEGRPRTSALTMAPFGGSVIAVCMDLTSAEEREPRDARAATLAARLTPKQREVLVLVAEGLSSREIGGRLGVSERTVETHREQLMDRLDVRGAAALARFAISAGLL